MLHIKETYQVNAKITKASIDLNHNGSLGLCFIFEYGDSLGQQFFYNLSDFDTGTKETQDIGDTARVIQGILSATEVKEWSDLKNTYVRLKVTGDTLDREVLGIGHIIKNKCFYF